jgi:N-acetylmuramoyl-L-alanine amidase
MHPVQIIFRTVLVAIFLATLVNLWTPASGFFAGGLSRQLDLLLTSQPPRDPPRTPQAGQLKVGIVAGHGGNDSGAVCRDANGDVTLTEADLNVKIASIVQQRLTDEGYQVDLLNEFDTRLNGYRAVALVSIHNDSCEFINDNATGFKISSAVNTRDFNRASRLNQCLVDRYSSATGLRFHSGSITEDMRDYHAFSEIDSNVTVAAIIEAGFMNLDYDLLVNQTDRVADGIVNGILCFLRNENVEPTPVPINTP